MKKYEIIQIIPFEKPFVAVFRYIDENDKSKSFYNVSEIYTLGVLKDSYGTSLHPLYWSLFKNCFESCYENDYFVGCATNELEAIEIFNLHNINKAINI